MDMSQASTRQSGVGWTWRALVAVLGGYALASAWAVLWGARDVARVDGILAGEQTGWLVYVAAMIWAFSPVALARVVGVFAAATLGLLLAAVWLAQRGADRCCNLSPAAVRRKVDGGRHRPGCTPGVACGAPGCCLPSF